MAHEAESNNFPNPTLARRRLLIAAGVGAFSTLVLGTHLLDASPRSQQNANKASQTQQQSQEAIKNHEPLQTKYFATDLIDAAARSMILYPENATKVQALVGMFSTTAVGAYIVQKNSEFFNALVSGVGIEVGSAVTARTIDDISTWAAAAALTDPKAKEYGIDVYFYENSEQLPSRPTPGDVISNYVRNMPELVGVSLLLPVLGTLYLGCIPFIARDNFEVAQIITESIKLGDQVKQMIEKRKTAEEIEAYLNSIGQSESDTSANKKTNS